MEFRLSDRDDRKKEWMFSAFRVFVVGDVTFLTAEQLAKVVKGPQTSLEAMMESQLR